MILIWILLNKWCGKERGKKPLEKNERILGSVMHENGVPGSSAVIFSMVAEALGTG